MNAIDADGQLPADFDGLAAIDAALGTNPAPEVEAGSEPASVSLSNGDQEEISDHGVPVDSGPVLRSDLCAFNDGIRRSSTDHDTTNRNSAIVRRLAASGPYRALFRLPEDWERRLGARRRSAVTATDMPDDTQTHRMGFLTRCLPIVAVALSDHVQSTGSSGTVAAPHQP